jgi:glycosyltransferase involved in cell wall biosynthesis
MMQTSSRNFLSEAFGQAGKPRATRGTPHYNRIVFWEPCVSPHKSAFFEAVAQRFGPTVEVMCVAHEDIPAERRALGWQDETAQSVRTLVAPSTETIRHLVEQSSVGCLHVFAGTRWFSTLTTGLRMVRQQGRDFALMSEPRDSDGIAGAVRFIQSWLTESALRRDARFVLAIGRHGPSWYRAVGYPVRRIFAFAYFLPSPVTTTASAAAAAAPAAAALSQGRIMREARSGSDPLRLAYVGRLVEAKGVHFLLAALAKLKRPAQLTVIGAGPQANELKQQARELGIDAEFCGALPIDQVQLRMHGFDILVLPSLSRDDGWGAVVSEALLAGTAVVASASAGASILLEHGNNGRVVPAADSSALASAVDELAGSGQLQKTARSARMTWAGQRLTAAAGAAYFERIVKHCNGAAERPKEFYL